MWYSNSDKPVVKKNIVFGKSFEIPYGLQKGFISDAKNWHKRTKFAASSAQEASFIQF